MFPFLLRVIFPIAMFCLATGARAAVIEAYDDPDHGCIARLSGPIEAGDAGRLRALLGRLAGEPRYAAFMSVHADPFEMSLMEPRNLCLDSRGGSYTEAIRLIEVVHGGLGTVVAAGAECLSACSLVFMAGSHNTGTDIGILPNRFLHVDGRLGFHAPDLRVPRGAYSEAEVQRAYQVSVAATGELLRRLARLDVRASLVARMYATPPGEMFIVTDVREAARWNISVLGVAPVSVLTDVMVRNGCINMYRTTRDLNTNEPDDWSLPVSNVVTPVEQVTNYGRRSYSYAGFGMEAAGRCVLTELEDPPYTVHDFRGRGTAISAPVVGTAETRDAEPPVFFKFMENWMLYPGQMPLAALPRADGGARSVTRAGTCRVLDGARLLDEEPCSRSFEVTRDGGGVELFQWPSGARTARETAGRRVTINGADAYPAYGLPAGLPRGTDCVQNASSGRTFCFSAN